MSRPYERLIRSCEHVAHECDDFVPWYDDKTGAHRGWKRIEVDTEYPERDYYVVNGIDVAVYRPGDGSKVVVIDNDPSNVISYGEDWKIGMGTSFRYGNRGIRTAVFREGSEEFAACRYNEIGEIACLFDLFMNEETLSIGETVRKNVEAIEAERKRVSELVARFRASYGDEAEVLLVKYNLQDM